MDDAILTESYAIWSKASTKALPFSRQLDSMLSTCVYYPEEEWSTFNYRPPDNADLLGSWRSQNGEAFIFLLKGAMGKSASQAPDLRVLITGKSGYVKAISRQIVAHKGALERIEKRELAIRKADDNFNEEIRTKSFQRFAIIVGMFSVIINAFSLYLRKLPVPAFREERFLDLYMELIAIIHVSALLLLLLIIALAIAYVLKFGALLMRRRK